MIRFNLIEKLKLVFKINSSKEIKKDDRKVGVVDEGINSTFINCEGYGPDAGLISKGKGLKSINSKWTATGKK